MMKYTLYGEGDWLSMPLCLDIGMDRLRAMLCFLCTIWDEESIPGCV